MHKKASALILSTLIMAPMAASCGSDEAPYSPVTPNILEFVKTICTTAFRCCTQGEVGYYVGTFLTEKNCADRLSEAIAVDPAASFNANDLVGPGGQAIGDLAQLSVLVPNLGALDRAVREGRTTIDAGALAKCQKFLKNVDCNQPAPKQTKTSCQPLPEPPKPGDCDPKRLYIGTLAEGAPCTSKGRSYECGPGLICVGNELLGQTGQCVREGKEGDYCLLEFDTCAEGLYCSALDGTCKTPAKEGEPGEDSDLLATADANSLKGTLLVSCRADLECDPVTETCVVNCQEGHSCGSDDDCDATTDPPLKCIAGRCDTPRAEGLPCVADENCEESLFCGQDPAKPGKRTCRVREPDGTPCTSLIGGLAGARQCEGFCDLSKLVCAPQLAPGSPCPTGQDDQCDNGYCSPSSYCTSDTQCKGSTCDLAQYQCKRICIASKPAGAPCTTGTVNECAPNECVANFCRKLPLDNGLECETNSQCDSNFCNLDTPRVCAELPLELGKRCTSGDQCDSLVCYGDSTSINKTCTTGRQEGELCAESVGDLDCDPHFFYCDMTLDQPRCTAFRETGAECSSNEQCRSGSCETHRQRRLCSPAAAPEKAICDGED